MGRLFEHLGLTMPKSLAIKLGQAPAKREKDEAPTVANAAADPAKLMARHQKIKPDLDVAIKKGGELAVRVRKQLDEFSRLVAAKKLDGAVEIIGRLEELVWLDSGKVPDAVTQGGGASADPDDAALVEQMNTIDDYLGSVTDETLKAKLVAEFASLRGAQKNARDLGDAKKRTAALKAAMPPVKALLVKASQLAMRAQEKRNVAAAGAEVEAMLSQVTALVLGAIAADAPRTAINAQLTKLQANVDKAKKFADPKQAMAAWNALKPAAGDLVGKAEAAAGADKWSDGQLKPLLDAAKTAIDALAAAGPKSALGAELAAIRAEIDKFKKTNDVAALQTAVAPRLQKLHLLVTGLGPASQRADDELARAARIVEAFDAKRSVEIRASLKTLQEHKKTAWPVGTTLAEIDAAAATFEASVRRLIGDAELLKLKFDSLKDLEALKVRFDALKPRIDKAADPKAPKFFAKEQKAVAGGVVAFDAAVVKEDLKAAQAAYAAVAKALDNLDVFREAWDKFQEKLAAAKAGEIKTALAIKLAPAALAATRDKAVKKGENDLVALADSGYSTNAGKKISDWIIGAKAWAGAKEAYDLLHGDKPTAAGLEKLSKAPGGGPVLDALVADLPDDIPQEVLTAAVQARYGIVVKQYDHRDGKGSGGKRAAANPKTPDKALKGLYSVLGKVPLKDTAKVKSIDRYTEETGGAAYGGGEIDLYCGRPGDGKVQELNKPGEVMPAGQKVDKNCEPVNTAEKAGYFDFATLHEVGHAVDDKKNIMNGGRDKDAGWLAHSAAAIAAIAAAHLKYDTAYVQAMMESKANTPPAKKPPLPVGREAAEWDLARQVAEDWVTGVRVTAGLWWHAADCKVRAIGDRVYQEAYAGEWVSYKLSARAQGVTGYQFRSPAEWFAELYAAYFMKKMNPKHPAAVWLDKLKAEAN